MRYATKGAISDHELPQKVHGRLASKEEAPPPNFEVYEPLHATAMGERVLLLCMQQQCACRLTMFGAKTAKHVPSSRLEPLKAIKTLSFQSHLLPHIPGATAGFSLSNCRA